MNDLELEIPSIDELEPMTEEMEERLSELFQLFIDEEITDPSVRARVEALANANDDTIRMFQDQMDITKTIETRMKPLKPSKDFSERVQKRVAETASRARSVRFITVGAILALGVILLAVLTLSGGKHDGLSVASGEIQAIDPENGDTQTLAVGGIIQPGVSYITPGVFNPDEITAAAAVLRDADRNIMVSAGASFVLKRSGNDLIVDVSPGAQRYRISAMDSRVILKVDTTQVIVPYLPADESARRAEVDILIDVAGTMRVAVITAAVKISGPGIDSPAIVPESRMDTIMRGKGITDRRNISPEQFNWR